MGTLDLAGRCLAAMNHPGLIVKETLLLKEDQVGLKHSKAPPIATTDYRERSHTQIYSKSLKRTMSVTVAQAIIRLRCCRWDCYIVTVIECDLYNVRYESLTQTLIQ